MAALFFLAEPAEEEDEEAEPAPDGEKRRSMPKTETDLREPRREQTGTLRTGATRTCAEYDRSMPPLPGPALRWRRPPARLLGLLELRPRPLNTTLPAAFRRGLSAATADGGGGGGGGGDWDWELVDDIDTDACCCCDGVSRILGGSRLWCCDDDDGGGASA